MSIRSTGPRCDGHVIGFPDLRLFDRDEIARRGVERVGWVVVFSPMVPRLYARKRFIPSSNWD